MAGHADIVIKKIEAALALSNRSNMTIEQRLDLFKQSYKAISEAVQESGDS